MAKSLITKELNKLGKFITDKMKNDVPVDTGKLKSSIKYKVDETSLSISLLYYGEAVDEGTKPHHPPIKAIEGWSRRKGLNPWAVAKKISKFGTKPQKFMGDLKNFEKLYGKQLEQIIGEHIEVVLDKKLLK